MLEALAPALANDGPAVLPVAGGSATPRPTEVRRAIALVIETSGSTGAPKRVALTTDALLASAAGSAGALPVPARGGTSQWLLALPAHYIAGAQVLVRSLVAGTDPVILDSGPFEPALFADAATGMSGDASFVSLVPTQLARLLDAADLDPGLLPALRRFDAMLLGGQALPATLASRARDAGLRVVTTYGSSETAGGCVYDGVPFATVGARVADGVLELAGPMLAEGYVGDPDRTAESFVSGDGRRWYRTGDLGEVDPDGRVVVLGRADDVIISGGEKVRLGAVEQRVREHSGLGDAVVLGMPDERWGEVPVVVAAVAVDLPELRTWVRESLGRAAAPARVIAVDAIPLLLSGKPDRQALRALVDDVAG